MIDRQQGPLRHLGVRELFRVSAVGSVAEPGEVGVRKCTSLKVALGWSMPPSLGCLDGKWIEVVAA